MGRTRRVGAMLALCLATIVLDAKGGSAWEIVHAAAIVPVAACARENAPADISNVAPVTLPWSTVSQGLGPWRGEADVVVRIDARGKPTYIGVHADSESLRRAVLIAARASIYRPFVYGCHTSGARFHYKVTYEYHQYTYDVVSMEHPDGGMLSIDDLEPADRAAKRRCMPAATLLHAAPVEVPLIARQQGILGDVVVAVRVASDGHVVGASVLSGQPFLRRAALDAARQTTFRPGCIAGRPRATTVRYRVPFDANPTDVEFR